MADPSSSDESVALLVAPKKPKSFLRPIILVILLIAGGGGGFFLLFNKTNQLLPTAPTATMRSLDFDQSDPSWQDPTDGTWYSNWNAQIRIDNRKNWWGVRLRQIHLNIFLPSNLQWPVGVGQAEDICVERRGNTDFTMRLRVPVYAPSSGRPSLIAECLGSERIRIIVNASIDLALLHWTGWRLKRSLPMLIDCKLPSEF